MDPTLVVVTNALQEKHLNLIKCRICNQVALQPLVCKNDHLFCANCITAALSRHAKCPVDEAAQKADELKRSHFAAAILETLVVRCPNLPRPPSLRTLVNQPRACGWTGDVHSMSAHAAACDFRCDACARCGKRVPPVARDAHDRQCPPRGTRCHLCSAVVPAAVEGGLRKHFEHCPNVNVFCPNHCLLRPPNADVTLLRRADVDRHLRTCPKRQRACELAPLGCRFVGDEAAVRRHERDYAVQHVAVLSRRLVAMSERLRDMGVELAEPSSAPAVAAAAGVCAVTPPPAEQPADAQ